MRLTKSMLPIKFVPLTKPMPLTKRTLFFLPVFLFFGHANAQWWPPRIWHNIKSAPPFHRDLRDSLVAFKTRRMQEATGPHGRGGLYGYPRDTTLTIPPRRWLLSFNPLGLLEGAFGIGIGYRLNKHSELWSETSLLGGRPYAGATPMTGFRQIIQYKRWLPFGPDDNFFLAFEARYKQYSYRDTNDFANPVTMNTLKNVHFLSDHYVFGAALQAGHRNLLLRSKTLAVEAILGIGYKYKIIDRRGPPAGYVYQDLGESIDLNIRDLVEQAGSTIYFPGSVRLIYFFGRKLK
jgi:hypothetical protein